MKINAFDKVILLILAFVIFYVALFFYADVEKILNNLSNIKWNYYPIIFLIVFSYSLISGFRYHILLKKIGVKTTIKDSIIISIAGQSLLITPGGVGSLIKSYLIKKKFGNSIASTSSTIFVERWLELVSITSLVLVMLIWVNMIESQIVFFLGIIIIVFSFLVIRNTKIFSIISLIFSKIKFAKKFLLAIDESKKSFSPLLNIKTLSSTFGLTLITKILNLFVVFFIFSSVGLNFSIFLSGQIYYTSVLAGTLTLIPGGIVVTDASMLGLILKNNVDIATASLVIILTRFITMWLGTLIGVVVLKTSVLSKYVSKDD